MTASRLSDASASPLAAHLAVRDVPAAMIEALKVRFGERCSTVASVREQHGRDESPFTQVPPPAAVVFAESTADVADTVRLAAAHRVPVIPYGAGSSLEGHLLAVQGGISLDLGRMARILAVHAGDMTITVQPGVVRTAVNRALEGKGLFFPVDPGADASIGGMCATRASGTNAVRYGTMRENVLALEVVTASGGVIRTGTRARKSSAGYDLTRLLVGSEGTLGIITEVQLRLYGLPEAISAAVCQFPDLKSAVDTVIVAMQLGIPVARIELLDDVQMDACIRYSKLTGFEAKPTLFFEFHGSEAGVREQAETIQSLAADNGGSSFQWATKPEDRSRLWKARHNAYYAALALAPGKQGFATDACVPISRLTDCVLETQADVVQTGLIAPIVGHVGDGNFHLVVLFDPAKADERAKAEALAARVAMRAIAMGGTCTGEHGVGMHKLDALVAEHGEAVTLMKAVKRALDPYDILNPGKTVPP